MQEQHAVDRKAAKRKLLASTGQNSREKVQATDSASSAPVPDTNHSVNPGTRKVIGVEVWKVSTSVPELKTGKKDEKAGWVCTGLECGYVNFKHRKACHKCGAVLLSAGGGSSAPDKAMARVNSSAVTSATARHIAIVRHKGKGRTKVTDPARAWASADNSEEKLQANKKLREAYAKDPGSMSSEDKARARILIERDQRKAAKKSQLKSAKEARRNKIQDIRVDYRQHRKDSKS